MEEREQEEKKNEEKVDEENEDGGIPVQVDIRQLFITTAVLQNDGIYIEQHQIQRVVLGISE